MDGVNKMVGLAYQRFASAPLDPPYSCQPHGQCLLKT